MLVLRRCFSSQTANLAHFHAAYEKLLMEARQDKYVLRLLEGTRRGERAILSEAITLVESTNTIKRQRAERLLSLVLEGERSQRKADGASGSSMRIGISGAPGSGKSTFIEALGSLLTGSGERVACLTVDPSSRITGGSLLGDKTRMPNLSADPHAFIRPSPTSGVLGGVTRTTSEVILLCESAGFNFVLVETVGSGQNEYVVADMTDLFILLIPPAGGDELQAIKKGIVELTDLIVVNKSDGDLIPAARRTQTEYISALKFLPSRNRFWAPKVVRLSSVTGEGLDKCWDMIRQYRTTSLESGEFQRKRRAQNSLWMWRFINEHLQDLFQRDAHVSLLANEVEAAVLAERITPLAAARFLLSIFLDKKLEFA